MQRLDRPALPFQECDVPTLIAIWDRAMSDFIAAATDGGPDTWTLRSACPGWSVGDVVAHVMSIERLLLGESDPPHQPDWEQLPHVSGDFGWLTEIPVDLRRSRSREDVVDEFRDTIAARHEALEDGPQRLDDQVVNPFGVQVPLDDMLRTRIFDTWVHEQDVRSGTGADGHWATPPAWIAADRLAASFAYVWGKVVAAPEGTTAHVAVTGPGVQFTTTVGRLPGGRGATIRDVDVPTIRVELTWPDLMRLGCGRVPAESGPDRARLSGDGELAARFVRSLSVTP